MTAQRPFFSIVITCYNYGHTLPRVLDSALRQQVEPLDVLVIDDGSTDNTAAVVETRDAFLAVAGGKPFPADCDGLEYPQLLIWLRCAKIDQPTACIL